MKPRQRPQACQCEAEGTLGVEFQKILECEEAGIVIYRYVPNTNDAGKGESYIVRNTKNKQATSEVFTIAFAQNKIICPRCVKILEHAESLVKYIPLIESQDVVSICDHCCRNGEKKRPRSSCWCTQIVDNFLIGRRLEEVRSRKHRIKLWLLEAQQVLQNAASRGIDKRLVTNKTMDKVLAQVEHVPLKRVEPTDNPPTGVKVRQPPFPESDYTISHGLMKRDPSLDDAMQNVSRVNDMQFKQLELTVSLSTELKVRKPQFPESSHTDSHGLMRHNRSLDDSLQKHFEKDSLLNCFYKNNRTRESTKVPEEKPLEKKGGKEPAPFNIPSFLDITEENVTPECKTKIFSISKSQEGKIKETHKRPSLKREKKHLLGRERRGLPSKSNRLSSEGILKPVNEHDATKVFSFLFPQEKNIPSSSSIRLASSTELLKNMQDMFKAQAEQKRRAEDDYLKKKREHERNKIIDAAQLILEDNKLQDGRIRHDKKSNTLIKDTDSPFAFSKEKKVERASIDKEASRYGNAYTTADANEHKDHKKNERKEQVRKEKEEKDREKKEHSKIRQENKREKEEQIHKDKEEKDKIKKEKQEQARNDKEEKRREKQDQSHKNKDKFNDFKDGQPKEVISKDTASKGIILKNVASKGLISKDARSKGLISKDVTSKGVTLKDGTPKREKPGDEILKPEKAKEEKLKGIKAKEQKLKDVTGKEDLIQGWKANDEKVKEEKLKKKFQILQTGEQLNSEKKKNEEEMAPKQNNEFKYTLVASQPTLKDKPETKALHNFHVVIPERPKPIMVVKKPQQEIKNKEIKLTKAREELILKLIRMKQSKQPSEEKYKPKQGANFASKKVSHKKAMEAYNLYDESDLMLELADFEETLKMSTASKRHDDDEAIIIGTQIHNENLNK